MDGVDLDARRLERGLGPLANEERMKSELCGNLGKGKGRYWGGERGEKHDV